MRNRNLFFEGENLKSFLTTEPTTELCSREQPNPQKMAATNAGITDQDLDNCLDLFLDKKLAEGEWEELTTVDNVGKCTIYRAKLGVLLSLIFTILF
jgi:hypothetical protein